MNLNKAFQGLPIGLCHFDLDLRYTYINDWLAHLNGVSPEDHIGRTIEEILPEVADSVTPELRQVIEFGEPILGGEVEAETPAQPGKLRTFKHSYIPIKSNSGDVHGLSCVVEEIFQPKQNNIAGESSELRFRTLYHQSPLGMILEDYSQVLRLLDKLVSDGVKDIEQYLLDHKEDMRKIISTVRLLEANDTQIKMFSASTFEEYKEFEENFEAWKDCNWSKYYAGEFAALAAGKLTYTAELEDIQTDGTVIDLRCTTRVVTNGEQRLPEVITTHEDITEHKNVERELAQRMRELSFQKLALDEHAIVSITDVKGTITYANEAFSAISGYSRDELVGQSHQIVRSDEHPSEFFEEMWHTIASGEVWSGEIKNRKKDGGCYWVKATILPFLNDQGKPVQYIAIRTDITERKEAEISAQKFQRKAELASQAKSDFLSSMSHELRTPLNAIIGFSETLKSQALGALGDERYQEISEDIHQSGQHLLELINDILDISAFEAGAMKLNEENIILADVVKASIHIIGPRASKGRVSINSSISSEIPLIYGDSRRIKQVLLNLLSNAVKFTAEGGDVSVVATLNDNGSLAIVITDTGVGMDDKEIEIALSKFGQVDSGLARKHEGTGLGLPLTMELMELHGGTLTLKSEKGKGTEITTTIPKERVVQNI